MSDETQVIGIFGRRGSGKSTHAKNFLKRQKKFLLFDPHDEYTEFQNLTGLERKYAQALALVKGEEAHANHLRVVPENMEYEEFEAFCQMCHSLRDTWVAFDEINLFTSSAIQHDAFEKLVRTSRRNNTSILVISQRPVGLPTIVLSQATSLILFHLHSERDLRPLKDLVTPEDLDTIRTLPQYQHLEILL